MDSAIRPKKPKLIDNSAEGSSSGAPLATYAVGAETAAPQAPVSNEHDLFNKVFSNDVIWGKLSRYLSLDDLKDCRLTCQIFNAKIMNLKGFKDRAILNIPYPKFRASDFAQTPVQWRHVAINFDRYTGHQNPENWTNPPQDPLSDLWPLVSSAISLKFHRTHHVIFGMHPQWFSTDLPILPNIQKITIDVRIFERISPSWFAYASMALMSNVKEFHLEGDPKSYVPDDVVCIAVSLPWACVHLEVLRMDLNLAECNYLRAPDKVIDRLDRLFRALRQNQNHLKSLQVDDTQLWTAVSANRFGTFPKFPQLKVLKLEVETEARCHAFFSEAYFCEFLNNQPDSLEEIDLKFKGSIPSTVFQIIKHRAMNLKVLRIKTTEFYHDLADLGQWNFLKETKLEGFCFELDGGSVWLSNEQLADFFLALPQHAKKLSITGVEPTGRQRVLILQTPNCFDPELLTHLNLRRCPGLLNDSVLQEFWRTLKNLRQLNLSNCGNNCTDWGFTGIFFGVVLGGASISWLKDLKSLSLQNCVGITNRTLIDGMKFPELQFLDLFGNMQFTDEGYFAVMNQNPSLQTLVLAPEAYGEWLSPKRRGRYAKLTTRLTMKFCRDVEADYCFSNVHSDDEEESGN